MARRKKRVGLPRVTVLAFSKRELATFAAAVETLVRLAGELEKMLPAYIGAANAIVQGVAAKAKKARQPKAAETQAERVTEEMTKDYNDAGH
jgi:hypothetical protein